jgi:hypothetical protein
MKLSNFKLYRWWKGGKWVLFKGKWYTTICNGDHVLHDFVDCDDGEGMFHYTFSGVERREDYGPPRSSRR